MLFTAYRWVSHIRSGWGELWYIIFTCFDMLLTHFTCLLLVNPVVLLGPSKIMSLKVATNTDPELFTLIGIKKKKEN